MTVPIINKTFYKILLICFTAQLAIAGTTGKLVGRVSSKVTGEPLIGANVILEGTGIGTATDLEGRYFILQIPPGEYDVRYTMIGYQDVITRDVRIRVDLTTTINTALDEGVIGMDAVEVTADRPMVQVDVTYSQSNINSDEIDMLPVEEFEDVIALQAGVVQSGGDMHVRGGRGGEIAYMIDGITVTDPFNAGMAVEIENNAIQELQFISGTFNAEYGSAMSGIINIVTKDGDFNKYNGNISVNGGSYFTKGQMMEVDLLNPQGSLREDSTMNLFPHLNMIEPNTISDFQGNFSGPILPGKISVFASGRFKRNRGYLFGQRLFVPESHVWNPQTNDYDLMTNADDTTGGYWDRVGGSPPDSQLVRMNWSEQSSGQIKFSWRITPWIKLAYNFMGSRTAYQDYSKTYLWNPDGRSNNFTKQTSHTLRLDYSLNASTYFNAMFSQSIKNFKSHLSDDPNHTLIQYTLNDTLYSGIFIYPNGTVVDTTIVGVINFADTSVYNVDPAVGNYTPGNNYEVGGESMGYYNRTSVINTFKIEGTSQLNRFHHVKAGLEYRQTNIELQDVIILLAGFTDNYPIIPDRDGVNHDSYGENGRNPFEYGAYLQDKIEFDDMVVNIGLRWDLFDPDWKTVNDGSDPNIINPVKPMNQFFDLDGDTAISEWEMTFANRKDEEDRLVSNAFGEPWYKKVKAKKQISPRFALAFPITDTGFLHFSYGHFFQMPNYSYLFSNPEFEVIPGSGAGTTMGNADMKPERTTQYEIGFSQQVGSDIGIEVTGYYKDIRNLNSTKIINSFIGGDRYGLFVNRDHANSKGITLSLSKRPTGTVSGNIDYTFSIAEGVASDPDAAFLDEQSNVEPEKILVPLDWDQRHTLNMSLTYHPVKNSGISIIYNFGSGLPYTAEFAGVRTSFENNARKPSTMNVDMRSFYNFNISGIRIALHLNVYNLFDIRNELSVYSDTGRTTYTLLPGYTPQISGPGYNTLDQYLMSPASFSSPRQIKFGMSVGF
ncbi:MAG: TonB-dependent receptor [Candidatus Marinimicrobia bacterium]|nr:TonB-dependent receptor [Candidatus Neomarinimicrobiota bacterium]